MAVVFVNLLRLSPSHHRMMDFAERPVTSAFGYPLLARSVNGRKLFATQLDSRRGLKPSATVCPFKGVEITSRGVNERSERVKRWQREREREREKDRMQTFSKVQVGSESFKVPGSRSRGHSCPYGSVGSLRLEFSCSHPIESVMPIHYLANLLFLPLFLQTSSPSSPVSQGRGTVTVAKGQGKVKYR